MAEYDSHINEYYDTYREMRPMTPEHENYEPLIPNQDVTTYAEQARRMADGISVCMVGMGSSRELSLAKTKLEECLHWINAHVGRIIGGDR